MRTISRDRSRRAHGRSRSSDLARSATRTGGGVFPEEAVARYIDGSDLPVAHAGDRNMPVWGPVFDATSRIVPGADSAGQRINAVIAYLREIQE